ncbi:MAG TPA: anthranilate synthase component I family protein [Parachlamydiaceae bacterium]|nr:anthranilate synthase component I family protein [Parachlamydiaceae bacterium]
MIAIDYSSLLFCKETLLKLSYFFSEEEGTCLLYSGGDFDSASESFLFLFPFEKIEIKENSDNKDWDEKKRWKFLQSNLSFAPDALSIPLWIGFLSYEMAGGASALQEIPYVYFQRSAVTFALNHQTNILTVYFVKEAKNSLSLEHQHWFDCFSSLSSLSCFLANLKEMECKKNYALSFSKQVEPFESYEKKIIEIQEMILNGDVYQVNLSHEIELEGEQDPFLFFYSLTKRNPAPFSAYFKHKDFVIASSSPERFLKKKNGFLETRPIKGTISRGLTEEEDIKNRQTLLNSEKDLAELLMITDLMRNDLGKISMAGSVKAKKIVHLEAYENVFHLLSIIESIPCPSFHPVELVQACFPGGSVTGCPKLSAMHAIQKLEKRRRGIYTGSLGYFAANGDFDFNIAIRTILFLKDKAHISLGGAITIDSQSKEEYQETLQKGFSILKALTLI